MDDGGAGTDPVMDVVRTATSAEALGPFSPCSPRHIVDVRVAM
ncbi:hypothetical protein RCO27_08200 [Sphingosinicella sp. LHD-64]|nr:hypothetical protein [Sphingosinicella sp. LHD-64]MDQ8756212.1 hypothetical protein [Sphingosinicella sp. LHD-64]